MKRIRKIFCLFIIIAFTGLFFVSATEDSKMKETALFKADTDKREIISLVNITDRLSLRYISVTTDEPTYWPDEDVFLKVLLPAHPNIEVEITLTKKDATPQKIGTVKLSGAGMLVRKIANGKERKLEPGEYSVEVKTADGKLVESTTYSVVEGALGALSFAHDFTALTDPSKLDNSKGAWFFGNAGGIGKRWGNGLNVKNEVRYLNQPYTGDAEVMTRCYLPGCDGVEAGPAKKVAIKNGLLEAVLDVGGHSGPFGIDVITDKGSVSYVFAKSGHVERQTIVVSGGLGNVFEATLAPYENTIPVAGRDIYITKSKSNNDDAFEITQVIADKHGEIEIYVRKTLDNPKLFVVHPDKENKIVTNEVALGKKLESGKRLIVKCFSPFSFIAIGGFEKDTLREGWAIAFTESGIDIEIDSRMSGLPSKQFDIGVRTTDSFTGKGIPVSGILEVFDNRVQSKSPKEQLVSAIGDSTREFSNYLVYWRDTTGIDDRDYEVSEEKSSNVRGAFLSSAKKEDAPAPSIAYSTSPNMQQSSTGTVNETTGANLPVEQETIREGEKKVVYCGLVTTNASGDATVSIVLPPQTGRVKVRFVAASGYDYAEKAKDVDVKKGSFLEVSLQPLIVPDARIAARAMAVNETTASLVLTVTGAGVEKELSFQVKPGTTEFDVPLVGKTYGKIRFQLRDQGGKALDTREIELRNIGSYPVTYSDVRLSDGKDILVPSGRRFAVYANPAMLLAGMVNNILTSMYSWFGHAESLSSQATIRAMLIASIDAKLIGDEGKRDTLKSDLAKVVKDLYDAFYDKNTKLFSAYPGIGTSDLWSMWASKNLSKAAAYLESSNALKTEFKDTIALAREMVTGVKDSFKKRNINTQELGQYNLETGADVVPVEIDGKVVFKVATDGAVIDWFVKKMMPILDIRATDQVELNKNFIKSFDTYRFLRSFERAGVYYYLSINAKALYLKSDPAFGEVFDKIARGVILIQEPGIIKGPTLLGGVYSSPASIMNFLDLLLLMAKDKTFEKTKVVIDGKETKLGSEPYVSEQLTKQATIRADRFTVLRIDNEAVINMYDYTARTALAKVSLDKTSLAIGGRAYISIELDKSLDSSEYYAIIAAPSVVSIKQTEDLLSDYKGQLIYGQRSSGGEKIQLITAPFRGKSTMLIEIEASQKGSSEGFVLVRHVSNPEIVSTVKIPSIIVK
jgi:hypothetical protein